MINTGISMIIVQSDLSTNLVLLKFSSILINLSYLSYFSLIINYNKTKLVERSAWTYNIGIPIISILMIDISKILAGWILSGWKRAKSLGGFHLLVHYMLNW